MYDCDQIARAAVEILTSDPRISLGAVSQRLGVESHTIRRAVRRTYGQSLNQLRASALVRRYHELSTEIPARSIKEIAWQLGYTPRAFSRRFKQVSGRSPRSAFSLQTPLEDTLLPKFSSGSSCSARSLVDGPNEQTAPLELSARFETR